MPGAPLPSWAVAQAARSSRVSCPESMGSVIRSARRLAAVSAGPKVAAPAFRVAIVGGGFAGAAAALRMIEAGDGSLAITVVEPRAALGRGIAYSTPEPGHLMNGPARAMWLYGPMGSGVFGGVRVWTGGMGRVTPCA